MGLGLLEAVIPLIVVLIVIVLFLWLLMVLLGGFAKATAVFMQLMTQLIPHVPVRQQPPVYYQQQPPQQAPPMPQHGYEESPGQYVYTGDRNAR